MTGVASWRTAVGWTLAFALPVVAVMGARAGTLHLNPVLRYPFLFLLALVAAKVGKWMTGAYWDQTLRSVLDDGLLALILAWVAYAAAKWLLRHGGGPVHPSLIAVAAAYLVIIWPLRI